MPYVSNMDIITYIDSEIDFLKNSSQLYEIFLFKDFLNNPLNLNQPSAIRVSIWNDSEKLLQYSSLFVSGTSGVLNLDLTGNTGKIDFTITAEQSQLIGSGNIYAEVAIIYENFYPQPKTYLFDKIKLGNLTDPNPGEIENIKPLFYNSVFEVENVDDTNPSASGRMSFNDNVPADVTKIKFRNLDSNGVRITELENMVINRLGADDSNVNITISINGNANMYAIYKILDWQRLDLIDNSNSDNTEDVDGIELTVEMEALSSGPGVTESEWKVLQEITFKLDAYSKPSNFSNEGVSTFEDKELHPTATSGNYASTGMTISYTPYADSYVTIDINGMLLDVGNGTRTQHVYFSNDGGLTAKEIKDIEAGDELYWNGEITGYDLDPQDEFSFIYETSEDFINQVEAGGVPTTDDKNLNPTQSTLGDESATGITITNTPLNDSNVEVEVNGIAIDLGNGVKDRDAYFSGDSGTTAKSIADIEAGDELYWNGNVVGFELDTSDSINLNYEVSAN